MAVTVVLVIAVLLALWFLARPVRGPNEAPGPFRWPIIGNLLNLRARVPYSAMTALGQIFGPVYSLQLGVVPTLVVSGLENIKQVLYHKSNHFDARPNFNRYHQIFDGDKENSLAFCDWSDVQRKRRELLNDHTFPKVYTNNFKQLDEIITDEVKDLLHEMITDQSITSAAAKKSPRFNLTEPDTIFTKKMKRLLKNKHISTFVRLPSIEEATESDIDVKNSIDLKEKILLTTANIFLRYFCSVKTEKDKDLMNFVKDFDNIFYEVNQGYASDFLPFLEIFSGKNIERSRKWSKNVRTFVESKILTGRLEKLNEEDEDKDYVDSLLRNVKFGDDVQLTLDTALFTLEDILGGHSAVGNFLVKLMTYVVDNEDIQEKIVKEVDLIGKDFVTLEDRDKMPYTESVIMEALRLISSPIVPHVANQDTELCGYSVKKGTLVFLNNYDLNMSPQLWSEPTKFDPSRFLDPNTGMRSKPVHFLPFGGGRRSCMGYKIVQLVSFVVVANMVKQFKVRGVPGEDYSQVPIGNLALPEDTFKFSFERR